MTFTMSERRRVGPLVVLELNGRLVMGEGSDRLDADLQRRINAGEQALLLDCAAVAGIDSQGIKALVRAAISLQTRGGKLKLLNLRPRVREVLELTRLLTVIESFDNEEAAVASFSNL